MERTSPAEPREYIDEQFLGGAALESFGNVIGNRRDGPLQLVPKSAPQPRRSFSQEVIAMIEEPGRALPCREIFESLVSHLR